MKPRDRVTLTAQGARVCDALDLENELEEGAEGVVLGPAGTNDGLLLRDFNGTVVVAVDDVMVKDALWQHDLYEREDEHAAVQRAHFPQTALGAS